jgi:superfamily II DNA or RNA helicase
VTKLYLREALYVPKRLFTDDHAEELSVKVWAMGAKKDEYEVVHAYRDLDGFIGVPRQWGLQTFNDCQIVDKRSRGDAVGFTKHIKLWDYQRGVVDRIHRRIEQGGDFVFKAATGKGKTIMMLEAAARFGRTTLIVVDQENLMTQWRERALSPDFLDLREDEVGIVRGKTCDWRRKKIVIAMMQSLAQRTYEDEFYDAFGLVIFDESHTAGAPTFSDTMLLFSAYTRVGVSATPDRRDALRKLVKWNLGETEVELGEQHRKSSVYYLKSFGVYSWYANVSPKTGRFITELSEDAARNWLACQAILKLYEQGRDILVIGDRIEQLWNLQNMAVVAGIPEEETGLYTGYRPVFGYRKDATPPRRPVGWVKDAPYTPIRYGLLQKKQSKKKLEEIKANSRILFATYGMFAKGVDVPRLAAGMDVTPRSMAQQVHGRILRPGKGKLTPIWVTFRDVNSYRAEYQFIQRLEEYRKSNAEIFEWRLDKGIKARGVESLTHEARERIRELKRCRTITQRDGSYTLLTQTTQIALAA